MKTILFVLGLTFLLINNANSSIQCYSCSGQSCSEVSSDTNIVTCSEDDFTTTVATTEPTTTTVTTTTTTTTEATTAESTTVTNEEDVIFVEFTTPQSEDIQLVEYTTPENEDIQFVEFTTPESEDIQFVEFTTPATAELQPFAEKHRSEEQIQTVQSITKNYLVRQRRNARNGGLLVCITASYLENGDQLTYRGCSIRSEEGFCSTTVPASSVVSCESCQGDLCNSARSIATSLAVLSSSLLLYYVIV